MKKPKIDEGQIWRHRNGILYQILMLSNLSAERPETYPVTVIYRGIANGKVWSRPLDDWYRSMTLVPTMPATAFGAKSSSVAVMYDLSPADTDSEIRSKLIEMGWTPPARQAAHVPSSCRERMRLEGKAYPRSNCQVCGEFSPKQAECSAMLASQPVVKS